MILKKIDISSEFARVYSYPNETALHISGVTLYITEDGGHRVLDTDGWVNYIPKGWTGLKWLPKDPLRAITA